MNNIDLKIKLLCLIKIGIFAILILFSTGLFFGVRHANACIMSFPFEMTTVEAAEVIIRGRIVGYEVLEDEFAAAKLSFLVMETYRGEHFPYREVVWQNSTFEIPGNLSEFINRYGGIDLGVALVSSGSVGQFDIERPSFAVIPPRNPDLWELPWVLQAPCAPPAMGDYRYFIPMLKQAGIIEWQ